METKESLDSRDITVNKYGQVILSADHLRDLLLQGKNINHLVVKKEEDIYLFNKYQTELLSETVTFQFETENNLSVEEFHNKCSNEWFFPESYKKIDVHQWLLNKCKTTEEHSRVNEEYELYKNRELIILLQFFIFLIDYMRENKLLWGVGRGSAVSSYILYLIGIHRVDSIFYNLDIHEYLK